MTLIRNDMLGLSQQKIPIKKLTKNLGLEDPLYLQEAIDAMCYLMLHMAKVKANEEEFLLIYDQSGLNPDKAFKKVMFEIVHPYIGDMREMLNQENLKETAQFSDLEWRLSMVTACRSKQRIMVPKYTLKMDLLSSTAATSQDSAAIQ